MSFFRTFWSRSDRPSSSSSSAELVPLFSDCVRAASAKTRECLLFRDPENRLHLSSSTLSQTFLMSFIQRSGQVRLSHALSCTAMTEEQRLLLGVHWVWAVLEPPPCRSPRLQIFVQVLHRGGAEEEEEEDDVYAQILRMAGMEAAERTRAERMVEFCSSVGGDCYALFLFFGRKEGEGDICGLLSNNLQAAAHKHVRMDRLFLEHFLNGAKGFQTQGGMLRALVGRASKDPLTMFVKFT